MFKSSPYTFLYRWIMGPLWVAILAGTIISVWQAGEEDVKLVVGFGTATIIVGAPWFAVLVLRLRNVRADDTGIYLQTSESEVKIDYKDVVWMYQIAAVNPGFISLKYYDHASGEAKKILIAPTVQSNERFRTNPAQELGMTTYLRSKIMEHNTSYSKAEEPSRWMPVILIGLCLLPIFGVLCYTLVATS